MVQPAAAADSTSDAETRASGAGSRSMSKGKLSPLDNGAGEHSPEPGVC